MTIKYILVALLVFLLRPQSVLGGQDARYCGTANCYDVLGLKESVSTTTIMATYRRLALEWHPDKNHHRKEEAEQAFARIAKAYSILRNKDTRADYDYALKHPDHVMYNAFRYYQHKYKEHKQYNPLLVLLAGLLLWSLYAYGSRSIMHAQAIEKYKESPAYKANLKQLKEDTLFEMERAGTIKRKMNGKRTRKEIDEVEVDERILTKQIVVHGSARKPKLSELAIVQFWLLPYHLFAALAWQARWLYKYGIRKEAYAQEDKEYLTRSVIGMTGETWGSLPDKEKGRAMALELWEAENEDKWREAQRAASRRESDDGDE